MQKYVAHIRLLRPLSSFSYQVTVVPDGYRSLNAPTKHFQTVLELAEILNLLGIQGLDLAGALTKLATDNILVLDNLAIEDRHLNVFGLQNLSHETAPEFTTID